jgi:hypothetical protein
MGSIHQLLNPVSTPPPQRYVSNKKNGVPDEEDGGDDDVVTLDAEAECYTPVELARLRASGMATSQLSGASGKTEILQRDGVDGKGDIGGSVPPKSRSGMSLQGNVDAARILNEMDQEDSSRRTSSSSLADILNPIEEPSVVSHGVPAKQPTPRTTPKERTPEAVVAKSMESDTTRATTSTQSKLPFTDATVSGGNETEDEEAIVDTVGSIKEETPMDIDVPSEQPTTNLDPTAESSSLTHPFTSEASTAVPPAVMSTPGDNIPALPSTVPTKRKFTPESSPDEPLTNNKSDSNTQTTPADVQAQIAVEKGQPPKAVKKPKKAPIKRPQNAKKKPTGGPKKPVARKLKEKSVSVGFDEVSP